jgi:hypothetical protein
MRYAFVLMPALLIIPAGPADAKISRYAIELGPAYCLIDRDHCLCGGFYRDLGNGACECRHAGGRIVRRNATTAPLCK